MVAAVQALSVFSTRSGSEGRRCSDSFAHKHSNIRTQLSCLSRWEAAGGVKGIPSARLIGDLACAPAVAYVNPKVRGPALWTAHALMATCHVAASDRPPGNPLKIGKAPTLAIHSGEPTVSPQ